MRMQAEISPKRSKAIIAPGNISVILIRIYIPSSMGYFSSIFPIASQKSSPFPKIPPPDSQYCYRHDVIIRILCIIRHFAFIFRMEG